MNSAEQFRLNCAIESGDFSRTQEMLNNGKADPTYNDYYAVRMAVKKRNGSILRALLKDTRVSLLGAKRAINLVDDYDGARFFEQHS